MATQITGVKIIIQLDNDEQWVDLTAYLSDEHAEAIETMLDAIEDEMNLAVQESTAGLH